MVLLTEWRRFKQQYVEPGANTKDKGKPLTPSTTPPTDGASVSSSSPGTPQNGDTALRRNCARFRLSPFSSPSPSSPMSNGHQPKGSVLLNIARRPPHSCGERLMPPFLPLFQPGRVRTSCQYLVPHCPTTAWHVQLRHVRPAFSGGGRNERHIPVDFRVQYRQVSPVHSRDAGGHGVSGAGAACASLPSHRRTEQQAAGHQDDSSNSSLSQGHDDQDSDGGIWFRAKNTNDSP